MRKRCNAFSLGGIVSAPTITNGSSPARRDRKSSALVRGWKYAFSHTGLYRLHSQPVCANATITITAAHAARLAGDASAAHPHAAARPSANVITTNAT